MGMLPFQHFLSDLFMFVQHGKTVASWRNTSLKFANIHQLHHKDICRRSKKKVKTVTCVVIGNGKYHFKNLYLWGVEGATTAKAAKRLWCFLELHKNPKFTFSLACSQDLAVSAAGRAFFRPREDWRQVKERIANLSPSCVAQGLRDFSVGEEMQKLVTELGKSRSYYKFRR